MIVVFNLIFFDIRNAYQPNTKLTSTCRQIVKKNTPVEAQRVVNTSSSPAVAGLLDQ